MGVAALELDEAVILHLAHHTDEVTAPKLAQVFGRESLGQQALGQHKIIGSRGQTSDAAIAVEVRANAHVVYAGYVDKVHDVSDSVYDGGLAVFAQEALIEGGLHHAVGSSSVRSWSSVRLRG